MRISNRARANAKIGKLTSLLAHRIDEVARKIGRHMQPDYLREESGSLLTHSYAGQDERDSVRSTREASFERAA